MIVLQMYCADLKDIKEVANWLLKENLAVAIDVDFNREQYRMVNNEIELSKIHKLTCVTRAAQFSNIDAYTKAHYKISLFSIPIVYMDWEAANLIAEPI